MDQFRTERDSMGEVRLPADAYYGPQTQRAVENFPISGRTLPPELIHALGLIKLIAARANRELGRLKDSHFDNLSAACREIADGRLDNQFPIDIYQTGSGTSSNMNANEVIARRANELSGNSLSETGATAGSPSSAGDIQRENTAGQASSGTRKKNNRIIHPNDHVNLGQSSNDVFPTAIHIAAATAISEQLIPALEKCGRILSQKAGEWQDVMKIGRTHLADATPITLGQEIGGMARQIERAVDRANSAVEALLELPIGGTAVGSGINTHAEFGRRVCEMLAKETEIPFIEATDHFEANSQRDGLVECHGLLKTIAVSLFTVANSIRWLASGPRCGFYEIKLPDRQPGSSIMPGKVNPVMCESLMQVAARVMGNDQTVTFCGAAGGQFQLNVMMPVAADALLESIRLMATATGAFAEFCLQGMEANEGKCRDSIEKSLAMATALNPHIGYERAAELAKEAFRTGKTIRQLCSEKNIMPPEQLDEVLDPRRMTHPS